MGRHRLPRQDPHTAPNRTRRGPAPLVHAVSKHIRHELRERYRAFTSAFRRAAAQLRAGILDVEFPVGSFPPSLPYVATPRPG